MIREASHQIDSCWTTEHSLRHCEGYHVYLGGAPIGYVDTVLTDSQGEVHSLLVRAGGAVTAVSLQAVAAIDPAGERIDLTDAGP